MAVSERLEVAREALLEITSPEDFGELISETVEEDGVVTMLFASTMAGYPGWHWTVSVAELPGEEPTVLEAELLPGEGALLAPDWVPWSERLEEYRSAQAALAAEAGEDVVADDEGALGDEDDEDVDDEDADDDLADDEDDDDLGDDPDDGIDFEEAGAFEDHSAEEESALLGLDVAAVGVEQADEPEGEADDAGPEPPAEPALDERSEEE